MCLYLSAELVPGAVFCILNSLSQNVFYVKEGERNGGGGNTVYEERFLARSFLGLIRGDFPMNLHDKLFK